MSPKAKNFDFKTDLQTVPQVLSEINRICKSLPERPAHTPLFDAKALIQNIDELQRRKLPVLKSSPNVPEELFSILKDMHKKWYHFQSVEQRQEAMQIIELDDVHNFFTDCALNAYKYANPSSSDSNFNPGPTYASTSDAASSSLHLGGMESFPKSKPSFPKDDTFLTRPNSSFRSLALGVANLASPKSQRPDPMLGPSTSTVSGQDGDKLSSPELDSSIETSLRNGSPNLNLRNKLMKDVNRLPDAIGRLSRLINLDLSENSITTLPQTMGGLASLKMLDLQCNMLDQLNDSIGNIPVLVSLNLRDNQLSSLPANIGNFYHLEELDLGSNRLSTIPKEIGTLVSLVILNVGTNDIEVLPESIGQCSHLRELRANFNRLKTLPESVGRIETLEVLTVCGNKIRRLLRSMSSLVKLRELDVSDNALELLPESICSCTSLVRLNVADNYANLLSLPRDIGNLEMLEELDISNNHISVLPDSFRRLTKLQVLSLNQNPLEVPPIEIAASGAQAVVEYMAELSIEKEKEQSMQSQRTGLAKLCIPLNINKRRHNEGPQQ